MSKPMACPMNCTNNRVARMAAITVVSLKSKLAYERHTT